MLQIKQIILIVLINLNNDKYVSCLGKLIKIFKPGNAAHE